MDGRKNNKGTKGNNGGRPPRVAEIQLIEQMDAIAAPAEAWAALWVKVQEGDTQAIKVWLSYRFGQPKQSVDLTNNGESFQPFIFNAKSDK